MQWEGFFLCKAAVLCSLLASCYRKQQQMINVYVCRFLYTEQTKVVGRVSMTMEIIINDSETNKREKYKKNRDNNGSLGWKLHTIFVGLLSWLQDK